MDPIRSKNKEKRFPPLMCAVFVILSLIFHPERKCQDARNKQFCSIFLFVKSCLELDTKILGGGINYIK